MTKIEKEKHILDKMIFLYCTKKHHALKALCPGCEVLKTYAMERLTNCPFKTDKKACRDCRIHCYQKDKRSEIRKVMRFSGPRMLYYYPFDFMQHILK